MDILNSDLALANEVAQQLKLKKNKKSHKKFGDDSNGFHYNAFLPIEGNVWKLDGLDYQPTNLG
jgi:ubiquitin carboxyl-terminal hydrolase L5